MEGHSRQRDSHRKGFTEVCGLGAGVRAHVGREMSWVVTGEELFEDSVCLPQEFEYYPASSGILYVIKSSLF